jgi:hypothetical protein
MKIARVLTIACAVATFSPALAQDQWPPKLLSDMECLKRHGLIQGTLTEVRRGEAHFAPYFRETAIGGRSPTIRYNGAFVAGRTKASPDIIKTCIPNATLNRNPN